MKPVLWRGKLAESGKAYGMIEYRYKVFSRLFKGNSRRGCYALALTIFSLGLFRDHLYLVALRNQPTISGVFDVTLTKGLAGFSMVVGYVLVISSMWELGIIGTYLGDYFGIFLEEKITRFPFSVCNSPMYTGSSLCFLGTALWYRSPAGIFMSIIVAAVYRIALIFEDPFTEQIYAKRACAAEKHEMKKA